MLWDNFPCKPFWTPESSVILNHIWVWYNLSKEIWYILGFNLENIEDTKYYCHLILIWNGLDETSVILEIKITRAPAGISFDQSYAVEKGFDY